MYLVSFSFQLITMQIPHQPLINAHHLMIPPLRFQSHYSISSGTLAVLPLSFSGTRVQRFAWFSHTNPHSSCTCCFLGYPFVLSCRLRTDYAVHRVVERCILCSAPSPQQWRHATVSPLFPSNRHGRQCGRFSFRGCYRLMIIPPTVEHTQKKIHLILT